LNLPPTQIVTGNTAHTRPENRAFYPALDGLRAIAFLMVFLQHYYALPWGWTGVNVFFVLSGFLITGILFDTRDRPHRARIFYMRRTLRIFPLYYGIFLALLLLYPLCHWDWSWPWLAWPLYLGNFLRFLSPMSAVVGSTQQLVADAQLHDVFSHTTFYMGHFWSLCVEEQFYLVWPWIVFRVRSRRALLWICGVTVVAGPLLRVVAQGAAPAWMVHQELLYRATPFQLDALLLGGLVALLWRGADAERLQAHRALLVRAGGIVATIAALMLIVYLARTVHPADLHWRRDYAYPAWQLTWALSFVNLFSAAVILCCLRTSGWLVRLLSLRPLRWLGRISYGAYVFHDIFHGVFYDIAYALGPHSHFFYAHLEIAVMLIGFAGTCALAWLSFRFFETPFLNLKERWTHRA
jgi:peptidoglycan/LPS O-acetylase OafA/YrhL